MFDYRSIKKCIFCQIVQGKQACFKIYEDKDCLAFLDNAPFTKGHTLIIPKKHYRWIWDIPNLGGFFEVVGKIVVHFQKITRDKFVSSMIWGNLIPHAHVHILPKPKNLLRNSLWPRRKLDKKEAREIQKTLALK